jgi:hypothetical protein
MTDGEAIRELLEIVRDEEIVQTIGWLAWGVGFVVIGVILFLILHVKAAAAAAHRPPTLEQTRQVIREELKRVVEAAK